MATTTTTTSTNRSEGRDATPTGDRESKSEFFENRPTFQRIELQNVAVASDDGKRKRVTMAQ